MKLFEYAEKKILSIPVFSLNYLTEISKVMIVFKFRPKFKFLNLDPKIFVLVPENGEFISLQENIKKYLF